MHKIITLFILILTFMLAGCGLIPIHKMDIEQGNIINQEMMNQLHKGMTLNQVKDIMGSPILLNTFNDNRTDYVYTFKPGHGNMTEQYITLIFRQERLSEISGNLYSPFIKGN